MKNFTGAFRSKDIMTDSTQPLNGPNSTDFNSLSVTKKAYVPPQLMLFNIEQTASGDQGVFESDGGAINAS